MKPMTEVLRQKIRIAIKNKIDISDLIQDVDIRGEDLSGSIISRFVRICNNLSGTNFSGAIIGSSEYLANFSNSTMKNCNFYNTRFPYKFFMRRCKAINCNFNNCYMPYIEYQYTDFTHSTFCEAVIRIGGKSGMGAIFSQNFFNELAKGWNVEIIKKQE